MSTVVCPRQRLPSYRTEETAPSWAISMQPDQYCQSVSTPRLHWPHLSSSGPFHSTVPLGTETHTDITRNAAPIMRSKDSSDDAKRRRRKYGPKPEPPYACFCGKVFKRHEHMLRHRATHDDGIKYDCGICGKSFRRQDVMHRHTLTHKGSSKSRKTSYSASTQSKGRQRIADRPPASSTRKVPLKESSKVSPARSANNSSDGSHHLNSPSYRSFPYGRLPKYPSTEALHEHQERSGTPISLAQHRSPSFFDARATSLPLDMPMMGMTPPPPFQAPALLNTLPFSNALSYPAFFDEHTGERIYGYGSSSVDSGYVEGMYRDDASDWANDGASRNCPTSPCLSTMAVYNTSMSVFASRDYDLRDSCTEVWPFSVPSQTEAHSNLTAVAASSFSSPFHQANTLPLYDNHFASDYQAGRQAETPRYGANNSLGSCSPVPSEVLPMRGAFTSPRNYFESSLPVVTKSTSTSEVFASSNLSRFVHNQNLATPTPGASTSFHHPRGGNSNLDSSCQQRKSPTNSRTEGGTLTSKVCSSKVIIDSNEDPFASASPLTDISDQNPAELEPSSATQTSRSLWNGSSLIDPDLVSSIPLRLDHLPTFSAVQKAN